MMFSPVNHFIWNGTETCQRGQVITVFGYSKSHCKEEYDLWGHGANISAQD